MTEGEEARTSVPITAYARCYPVTDVLTNLDGVVRKVMLVAIERRNQVHR